MSFAGARIRLCPSYKLSYFTRQDAEAVATDHQRPPPFRCYRCELCGLWHFTTQPYDQARREH